MRSLAVPAAALLLASCAAPQPAPDGSPAAPPPSASTSTEVSFPTSAAATRGPTPRPDPSTTAADWLADTGAPGVVLVVLGPDGTKVEAAAGFADGDRPMTSADTFYVGSVTKAFAAAAVLSFADEGTLDLDDPIAPLLPHRSIDPRITVRHLLAHTSGLPDYTRDAAAFLPSGEGGPGLDELIDGALGSRPLFEPGHSFSYCNTGYVLLGEVLGAVSGRPAHEVVRAVVVEPLGLADTFLAVAEPGTATAAPEGGRDPTTPEYPDHVTHAGTAGALVSSAPDLAAFVGALASGEVVSGEALEAMTTTSFEGAEYGLGIEIRVIAGEEAWGHTGGIAGYRSAVFHFPADGTTIAALVNTVERDADPVDLITAVRSGAGG